MKLKDISIKYSFVILIMMIIIPMLSFFIVFNYFAKKDYITEIAYLNMNSSKSSIVEKIRSTETGYELASIYYEPIMENALVEFRNILMSSDSEELDKKLLEMEEKYDYIMDFYIIDSKGIIVNSSFAPAKGLDFSIYPDFYQKLEGIRLSDNNVISRISTDLTSLELRKWGYVSSYDNKYVLEIGIKSKELEKHVDKLDYSMIENEILTENKLIDSVHIYDERFNNLNHAEKETTEKTLDMLVGVFLNKTDFQEFDINGLLSSEYIYLSTFDDYLDDSDRVVEIKYNLNSIYDEFKRTRNKSFITVLAYIILSSMLVYAFTNIFITRPVIDLSKKVDQISFNNLDFDFKHENNNEIGVLVRSFKNMIFVLGKTILSNEHLETLLNSSGDYLIVMDSGFKVIRVNEILAEFLGIKTSNIDKIPFDEIFMEPFDTNYYSELLEGRKCIQNIEQIIVNEEGSQMPVLVTLREVRDKMGDRDGFVATLTNITAIREKISNLEIMNERLSERHKFLVNESYIDYLTKAFNRKFFMREIKNLNENNIPYSIMMCDIDKFKKVNDSYGHLAGDIVLKEITKVIKEQLREKDYVCRYGGEEFIVIALDNDCERIRSMAERIREKIEKYEFNGGIRITISMGIQVYNSEIESVDKLIEAADSKLYIAKKNGRNRVEI